MPLTTSMDAMNPPPSYHHPRQRRLAGEDAGAGDLVVGDRGPVDADFDSGVGALLTQGLAIYNPFLGQERWMGTNLVSTREADGVRGRLAAGAANDCATMSAISALPIMLQGCKTSGDDRPLIWAHSM
jgi:hypothetical protein